MKTSHDLESDILGLLVEKDRRPSEIRKELFSKYEDVYDSERIFDVAISRELKNLVISRCVRRRSLGHANVSYSLLEKGFNKLSQVSLSGLIRYMPPAEVQVLQFLVHFFVSYVHIMAPPNSTLEDYVRLFRERINREDVENMARATMNDPKKTYAKFYTHLREYSAKKLIALRRS